MVIGVVGLMLIGIWGKDGKLRFQAKIGWPEIFWHDNKRESNKFLACRLVVDGGLSTTRNTCCLLEKRKF